MAWAKPATIWWNKRKYLFEGQGVTLPVPARAIQHGWYAQAQGEPIEA